MEAAVAQSIGLSVEGVSKAYPPSTRRIFKDLSFNLPRSGRLALLGRNGQGKTTLIRLLGGVQNPTEGRIRWMMSPSWPIGFGGGFQGSLTGSDNVQFLARLYDRDYKELLARVDDFAELGRSLRQPVKHYSSGMRARLAFGLSLAIEFDCYLIDELVAVGDARFQQKCREELFERRGDRAFILASHSPELIREHCDRALILESGKAKLFDDIEEAIEIYTWLRAA
ncbi:ABC transporter ATP-binding protein [Brevundimonas sp. S30B]|uniref:ABC transporter ATP-binding protein n=1 Tax=unclassified Brevundimonas TaxID=2622653 RepID=UPI0010716B25|nr:MULTISPECIES: ABC transporter ATP-binding protein [unclassified Brevundimonas]QBX36405.1 ABC transporter ATP-binding protein [Brevundimonas sp. MF30-B]TFW00657.1 ABC transporter ATP-binding protein [Brevundimonas sp. S30B]